MLATGTVRQILITILMVPHFQLLVATPRSQFSIRCQNYVKSERTSTKEKISTGSFISKFNFIHKVLLMVQAFASSRGVKNTNGPNVVFTEKFMKLAKQF